MDNYNSIIITYDVMHEVKVYEYPLTSIMKNQNLVKLIKTLDPDDIDPDDEECIFVFLFDESKLKFKLPTDFKKCSIYDYNTIVSDNNAYGLWNLIDIQHTKRFYKPYSSSDRITMNLAKKSVTACSLHYDFTWYFNTFEDLRLVKPKEVLTK